ncbi:hypothetical protein BBO_04964 [Beauveria brongniartii RCEF 3172]|uniref:Uncharacterized protein n=1 Tax=Beauveria brongniartii RCEF 3172 TaxID=1081107 RepID=A0A167DEZ5_9HYPO|nr:hypothetical protein BBO_04964 [Beauveria brongniartii RCEF 3172]
MALDDIDSVCAGAIDRKLLWAFELYWWVVKYYLSSIAAPDRRRRRHVGHRIPHAQSLAGASNVLENGQTNPKASRFSKRSNDVVRVYMIRSMIPQFVDTNGVPSNFDSVLEDMLEAFYETNKDISLADMVDEDNYAKFLTDDDFIRGPFFASLDMSMLLAGSLGSWTDVVENFTDMNKKSV